MAGTLVISLSRAHLTARSMISVPTSRSHSSKSDFCVVLPQLLRMVRAKKSREAGVIGGKSRFLDLRAAAPLTAGETDSGADVEDDSVAGVEGGSVADVDVEDDSVTGVDVEGGSVTGVEDGSIAGVEDGSIAGVEDGSIAGVEDGSGADVEAAAGGLLYICILSVVLYVYEELLVFHKLICWFSTN